MIVRVVYKDNSDHARAVLDFLRDFEHQTGHKLETVDPDTSSGSSFCRTYDIIEYPTMIATDNNGLLLDTWRGLPLPTISEVSYYAQ
ncbi:MAG: hypothetical protein JWN33_659 [Candidatus Saccharibacteria bacterium]|nr:hypothetical protein [Candidatus Saccharibacteria bacterium]